MPAYSAPDGTRLAYHLNGQGSPVVCLPGGPMQDSEYLQDLGALSRSARLILVDHRGTGQSEMPAEIDSCRCDRLVDDVEALREHLGLDRIDLLGHSAGANLAVLYAARHPERVNRLVLVTPSSFAVGIDVSTEMRREIIMRRKGDPLYEQVSAAFEAIAAGRGNGDDWEAIVPFSYGQWDAVAQAAHARGAERRNAAAAAVYGSEGAFDPRATRSTLATFPAPVLVVAGELDLAAPPRAVAQYVGLFPRATLLAVPGAGHFPWLDDSVGFARAIAAFLAE